MHVYCGLLLPVPLLARGARAPRHAPAHRPRPPQPLGRATTPVGSAVATATRCALGKFNPGQKLNAAFIAGAGVVMLGTGSIMNWFDLFPLDWRTGATFVHDWFALGIWVAVIGHIVFALRDGDALDSMIGGDRARGVGAHEGAPLVRGAAATALDPSLEPHGHHARHDRGRRRPRRPRRARSASSRRSCASRASAPIPAHAGDVDACADAVADLMRDAGLDDVRELARRRRAPVRRRRVDAPARRADRAALRAPRRATAGLRRAVVVRSVRAASSATAGSSAAAPPTTRRARSRTSPRCAPGSTPPARCRAT